MGEKFPSAMVFALVTTFAELYLLICFVLRNLRMQSIKLHLSTSNTFEHFGSNTSS